MTTIAERYDRSATAYLAWWAPVLGPTALGVIEAITPAVSGDGAGQRLLDVGTGAGVLAIAAAERWPALSVIGLDASGAMLDVARGEVERRLGRIAASRVELRTGMADRVPLPDASIDVAVSSFVMQLVPSRSPVLREARRVLRPGGRLAFVTWIACERPFAPDDAFYDVLDELGIPDAAEAEEARSGDFASVAAAAAQVRRAGFRDVRATGETLEHAYDPARYLEFLEQYAERDTFAELDEAQAREVRTRTAERLGRLAPDAFVWRAPVALVVARRP